MVSPNVRDTLAIFFLRSVGSSTGTGRKLGVTGVEGVEFDRLCEGEKKVGEGREALRAYELATEAWIVKVVFGEI